MSSDISEYTIGGDEIVEYGEDETQVLPKRRKLTSKAWKDFEKIRGPDREDLARCKHCNKVFAGGGTSHLFKHLAGRCPGLIETNSSRSTSKSHPIGGDEIVELQEDATQVLSKQRKLTSKVWQDFKKIKGPSGEDLARCKHCNREFVGGSKGTGHLLKHLAGRCPGPIGANASRSASKSSPTMGDENMKLGEDTTQVLCKQRKLTSRVWQDFNKIKGPSGEDLAQCKHCNREFVGGCKGTGHLLKHLAGRCLGLVEANAYGSTSKCSLDLTPKVILSGFDQERSCLDLARMIIKHNYPFNMAEHEYFEIFCNNLQPMFKLISKNTIGADVLSIYREEKEKLYQELVGLSCKFTLTTDIWTSNDQNLAYACVTVHYVTNDWELKKKMLAFKFIEYPHDGKTLFRYIKDLILEWNIDKKLFSMVVNDASNNAVMVRLLREWLVDQSLLPLTGKLFHVRCTAHMLNLIVHDGLRLIDGLISKIRESVRYLATEDAKQNFDLALNQVKLQGNKRVPMDDPTRWNSTFFMLETALELKSAFCCLEEIDKNYEHNPLEEEWDVGRVIHQSLKVFYDTSRHFSGTIFPTSNVFFPDICQIQLRLKEWKNSENEYLHLMVNPVCEKFGKYWENCCLLLAIAAILDPRLKLAIVKYYFGMIYGDDAETHVHRVRVAFTDLFNEYRGDISQSTGSTHSSAKQLLSSSSGDRLSSFYQWYMQDQASSIHETKKSELNQYLEELVFPGNENFNILHWWEINSAKFPTLARMARDILAIPSITVAPEAAFSVGSRTIDETRTSLPPDIVEALATGNDWIEFQT
ncbi:zinc finger BED domain-containing protein RICESLEEPER 2-like [Diospyros lotus]|uniref:zinc finger BED domain-containing protein RICESLEEPER 2-like n=1 Tax=Diospyros lotus TaxID=55363 RepID=UPI002250BA8C|nr:zinc finger BED domain-containing protein RICESLEEPER 2-like [Diospyros lotus]XP_052185153.1 zinc finger BED domain-containing protein RICESLEEPER 2-like [Diospyros lotus]